MSTIFSFKFDVLFSFSFAKLIWYDDDDDILFLRGRAPNDLQGLGSTTSSSTTEDDDLFDVYRKRMMLAYRYRPNPLNNPRRPYY